MCVISEAVNIAVRQQLAVLAKPIQPLIQIKLCAFKIVSRLFRTVQLVRRQQLAQFVILDINLILRVCVIHFVQFPIA